MKINQLILPALALGLGGAFLVSSSQEADAYSLIGGNLSQTQRDFRIFNNFTDAVANDNQIPDPQFPGYQGADMAIWKGCVEWSSIAHGTGAGDPTQSVLGSGGANFDPSFQGNATLVGGTNDNIHSELSGSNGGVLAYTETPISDGWRIRYYSGWTWSDGPGGPGFSPIDLQEVSCHEYGHALGLGHSTSGGATMYPSYSGGTAGRSISTDDINGVKAVYGAISASKPRITAVSFSGSQITVTGTNFDNSGNQIWFTQSAAGGNGQPIKVTGLTSNGTSLVANIPSGAGPGDILVRSNGTAHNDLSNPWPTDLSGVAGCNAPTLYCNSSPNSVGAGALIGQVGTTSISANDMILTCNAAIPGQPGLFFYGPNEALVLFGEGVRCVGGTLTRLTPQIAGNLGNINQSVNLNAFPFNSGGGAVTAGDVRNFQYWYRDVAGGPSGFNLSGGLKITFCL